MRSEYYLWWEVGSLQSREVLERLFDDLGRRVWCSGVMRGLVDVVRVVWKQEVRKRFIIITLLFIREWSWHKDISNTCRKYNSRYKPFLCSEFAFLSLSDWLTGLCLLCFLCLDDKNESVGPKMVSACLVSSSTTLVWCTVSTRLESEADPSVVFSNVGPNTTNR